MGRIERFGCDITRIRAGLLFLYLSLVAVTTVSVGDKHFSVYLNLGHQSRHLFWTYLDEYGLDWSERKEKRYYLRNINVCGWRYSYRFTRTKWS